MCDAHHPLSSTLKINQSLPPCFTVSTRESVSAAFLFLSLCLHWKQTVVTSGALPPEDFGERGRSRSLELTWTCRPESGCQLQFVGQRQQFRIG